MQKRKELIMNDDIFVRYNTREEMQDAFRKMLHAKEEWKAQVRELEHNAKLAI